MLIYNFNHMLNYCFYVFGMQLFLLWRGNMKLTKIRVLRWNISCWLLLRYSFFYMLKYSILWLIFCFWDSVTCVIKTKYKINRFVIKNVNKVKNMMHSYLCQKGEIWNYHNLWLFLYAQLLCFYNLFCVFRMQLFILT